MSVEFVDTNVLVYAYDSTTPDKHARASELLTRLWNDAGGVISVQVLQELYWTITRKVPKPLQPAAAST